MKEKVDVTNLVFASSGDLDVEETDFGRNERANEAAVLLALKKNLHKMDELALNSKVGR